MKTKEEDMVRSLFSASTHDTILFFTTQGRVYRLKGYEIPESGRQAKGTNLVNLLALQSGERVNSMIPIRDFETPAYLLMITRNGTAKKTALREYANIRKTGVIAILLDEGDDLIQVERTSGENSMVIATHEGKAIRFREEDVRAMGRVARGVRGIRLEGEDYVIGMVVTEEGKDLLTVTENGYGKRTATDEYRLQSRGGKGVANYKITEKTGKIAAIRMVEDGKDLMAVTDNGIILRTPIDEISTLSRSTQGVRIVRLAEGMRVIDVTLADAEEEEPETTEETAENE